MAKGKGAGWGPWDFVAYGLHQSPLLALILSFRALFAGYQEKACARLCPQHGSHLLGVVTSGSSDRSHLVPFYP